MPQQLLLFISLQLYTWPNCVQDQAHWLVCPSSIGPIGPFEPGTKLHLLAQLGKRPIGPSGPGIHLDSFVLHIKLSICVWTVQ